MTQVLNETREHGTVSPLGKRGDDTFSFSIPTREVLDYCQLTIVDKRFQANASISSEPSAGQTGEAKVAVHWWYDGGSKVKYRIEAFTRNANKPTQPYQPPITGIHPSSIGGSKPIDAQIPEEGIVTVLLDQISPGAVNYKGRCKENILRRTPSDARVTRVSNQPVGNRRIHLKYQGTSVILPLGGGRTELFNGLDLKGIWEAILEGEITSLPSQLALDVHWRV